MAAPTVMHCVEAVRNATDRAHDLDTVNSAPRAANVCQVSFYTFVGITRQRRTS